MNSGKSWTGPLLRVSGDVGKDISSGSHTIRWEVLEEMENLVGNNIQFKVVASGKKPYEPEMVFVKGGTFMMGSSSGEDDERPVHQVTLSDFSIGKYEVTQAQWRAVMGNNPSEFKGCDACPVETVTWKDAMKYVKKLSKKSGNNYRLPTEAEWEYAASGGNLIRGYSYSGNDNISAVSWYLENSNSKTHSVGEKQANELKIFDMTGNVREWCNDWYAAYPAASEVNPFGPFSGRCRVIRGGGWNSGTQYCRTPSRFLNSPEYCNSDLGFRLVLVPTH
jgi:formylglycine-generating enzyme required for sulfatase activity